MYKALNLVKSCAPCVLLIDEVAKALGGYKSSNSSDSGAIARAFGLVLEFLNDNDNVAIFSTRGLGKQVLLKDYPVQGRGGKGTITYKPTDSSGEVVGGVLINNTDNLLLVGNNSTIAISASEVPQLGKTALGNILMKDNELISIIKL